jgi:hypothetical protein
MVCFLVSFDRSEVSTHKERVHLLFKFRFHVKFFDFRVWAIRLSAASVCSPVLGAHYGAHANAG